MSSLMAFMVGAGAMAGAVSGIPVEEAMAEYYVAEPADAPFAAYTGKEAEAILIGEARKRAFRCNYVQLSVNYGDAVDFQLRQELVVVCPQTLEFLYSGFTPLETRYVKGSRPALEKVAAEATAGCSTAREKALALMRYCRDLYDEKWYTGAFGEYVYGGTEEELIEKGEILCECLGRLHVALCEVSGIPGRLVMHVVGGHICSEVHVDGGWAYMDPRCGMYFVKADGTLASLRDLLNDPGLVRAQPDEVKADVGPWWTWEERAWKCEHKYFRLEEVNGFEN
ncbi:MAG: transglutaminase family protein, partial [Candidatus Hydrogenedentes bacterium]|nr:transglutaminase family protein [Candidatus Hydrogenedentota bacterium]